MSEWRYEPEEDPGWLRRSGRTGAAEVEAESESEVGPKLYG